MDLNNGTIYLPLTVLPRLNAHGDTEGEEKRKRRSGHLTNICNTLVDLSCHGVLVTPYCVADESGLFG